MHRILYLVPLFMFSCGGETDTETDLQAEIDEKYAAGKAVYDKSCISCHQSDGLGMEGVFPPLAGSDYLLYDKSRAAYQVFHGLKGEITVNGETYDGIMPPQELSAEEVRDVLNYVLNSWGNDGGEITLEEVQKEQL
ncbi:MAG: cytochrome c [Crocinitomicaceae bacterium]|nr:cytochrome c [Crocinitomicaceae bacterium]